MFLIIKSIIWLTIFLLVGVFYLTPLVFLSGMINPKSVIFIPYVEDRSRINILKSCLIIFVSTLILLAFSSITLDYINHISEKQIAISNIFTAIVPIFYTTYNLLLLVSIINPKLLTKLGFLGTPDRWSIIRNLFPKIALFSILTSLTFTIDSILLSVFVLIIYIYVFYKFIYVNTRDKFEEFFRTNKITEKILGNNKDKIIDNLILENVNLRDEFRDFILNDTKMYDSLEIDNDAYLTNLSKFSDTIIKKIDNYALKNLEIIDSFSAHILKKSGSLGIIDIDIKQYINSRKMNIYIKELMNVLGVSEDYNSRLIIKKYVEYFRGDALNKMNIHVLASIICKYPFETVTLVEEELKIKEKENEKLLNIILENSYINNDFYEFILNKTKKFDSNEIDKNVYLKDLNNFSESLIIKIDNYSLSNTEKFNQYSTELIDNFDSIRLDHTDIKRVIDSRKMNIYIEELIDIIKISKEDNPQCVAKKYVECLKEDTFKPLNIDILSKILEKNNYQTTAIVEKQLKIKEMNENIEIFDEMFRDKNMKKNFQEFILNHTKKYDSGEMNSSLYKNHLDNYFNYLEKKLNYDIENSQEVDSYPSQKHGNKISALIFDKEDFLFYINNKKNEIYVKDMETILNITKKDDIQSKIYKYISVFGKSGLDDFNKSIFSELLNEEAEFINSKIKKEYSRVKEEYELRKLENSLFKNTNHQVGVEYVDTLSGFEFEDYLENIFKEYGYNSKKLPYSNDYGADLIISKGLNDIVIQAKNYNSGNVGVQAIQEVIFAKSYYKSDIAMVITNSFYTKNAREAARKSGVILIDREVLDIVLKEGRLYFSEIIKNKITLE